ncbi:MAG: class I SAM-dependent methyltransferase [Deltaproteobacteria bacterium]|nr:MAG: class I SAM-dependent methyltransferase [Deltaproteobacteria bacterium]
MKLLESAPSRYDRGIRWLSLGESEAAYQRLTQRIISDTLVLDIGTGTGSLTLRALRRGARVKGIDINPGMLEIARKKIDDSGLGQKAELKEQGAVELNEEPSDQYDAVMSGLCFSELSKPEQAFTLKECFRILKPGGLLLLADESRPNSLGKRLIQGLIRIPLVIITYLITQTTTRAVNNLPEKVRQAGFQIQEVCYGRLEGFIELVAIKPKVT